MSDFLVHGELSPSSVPIRVRALAEAIGRLHGLVSVSAEASGIQIYFACPRCLEIEGAKALASRKCSFNASKYLGMGLWQARRGTYMANSQVCSCMKCRTVFSLDQLQNYPPLSERGYKDSETVVIGSLERKLVPDGRGNMVPPGPGELVPIHQVPPDNPGRWYLEQRGYDCELLWRQFSCCWCVKELPENRELEIYYRRLPLDFRNTPQGRVVFFGQINGVTSGWQARIPEYVEGNHRYYWHPYHQQWVLCEFRESARDAWQPIPQIQASPLLWKDLNKYHGAKHMRKSELLLGYDAAREYQRLTGCKTGFLGEGPLDAGRFGPPAVGCMGKSLSLNQATLLLELFDHVVMFPDKGDAGQQAVRSVRAQLEHKCRLTIHDLPDYASDPGNLTCEDVQHYRKIYLA